MTTSVLDKTVEIISEKTGIDPENIKPETELSSIEIESLDLAEIIFDLEDEFDVEIDMNTATAWENLKTIQDIANSVTALIAKEK
ncbi:MAG: nodulation protein NodF [Ahrensia sp.]|nr:nodulation protein NodF [Ahrensia sp.]